jgi:hypothetical protein
LLVLLVLPALLEPLLGEGAFGDPVAVSPVEPVPLPAPVPGELVAAPGRLLPIPVYVPSPLPVPPGADWLVPAVVPGGLDKRPEFVPLGGVDPVAVLELGPAAFAAGLSWSTLGIAGPAVESAAAAAGFAGVADGTLGDEVPD